MICGLLGRNIKYSKSPEIHNEYYKKHNINFQYEIFDIKEDEIPNFIDSIKTNDVIGFNVTIPYKQIIIKYLTCLDDIAEKVGSVNTVLVKNEKLIGYNTDYFGFVNSINERGINLHDKKGIILGSGGSAKCVYYALKHLGLITIDVLCRNIDKAKKNMGDQCEITSFNSHIDFNKYDIIVNCTPLGGPNFINSSPVCLENLKLGTIVYDLNYIPQKSKLLVQAEKQGAEIINGSSMLKQQAYSAIEIWYANIERGDNNNEVIK